jgi:hypothetical protein
MCWFAAYQRRRPMGIRPGYGIGNRSRPTIRRL